MCIFLQGSSGDLGPHDGFVGDPSIADRNGRRVAYAALATFEALPAAETQFVYSGPVVSGAWIGTWRHEPLDDAARQRHKAWSWEQHTIELLYRPDLPTIDQTQRDFERFSAEEREAAAAGDAHRQRDSRAKVEQMTRQLLRLRSLPPGATFPFSIIVGQLGDALWMLVPGELYQIFQRTLRTRFAPRPVVVATLTNDWQPGYLPAASCFGTGVYPDTIASVAPGALEVLIESVTRLAQSMLCKTKPPSAASG
jgi:hypothetical protein